MLRHLAGRIGQSAVVLLIMSFVVYGLIGLMPGDPIDLMISSNPKLTPADAERLRHLYGLDQPLLGRWWAWLGAALSGDFGHSRLYARPVLEVMAAPLVNTLLLMGTALTLSLAIALPLGVLAGTRPGGWFDRAANLLAFAGISMPVFWLGLMLIVLFAVRLGWLPASGVETVGGGDRARHMVLPVLTLALAGIGQHLRYMRAAMIETLRQDWIRTARAKGLSWRRVVLRHALRHALTPVATVVALEAGALFSGALITETVFAWPGMGKLIYDSVMGNDFNLALATLLLATAVTLAANVAADFAYAALDPRITWR
ncbi:MAG: ABC transporter permease [Alphaproteobacteria bacterium]|nr:ABC transporter permease [Alphaproteobacteria bacterium]